MATRCIYVDVDDTLVRSFGSKRIAIDSTIDSVKALAARGVRLFCWSSGGSEYARSVAVELGLESCFEAFLPKPDGLIDDVHVSQWRLAQIHPTECRGRDVTELLQKLPSW